VLAAERRVRILEEVRGTRIVSTEDLSRALDVSGETIRRDLAGLEREGLLDRVHGGAAAPAARATGEEASYADRAASAQSAKERIGRAAAALVQSGQTVIIDVGTTALRVAHALPMDLTATVATCSLLVAAELADRPNLEVLVCGGRLRGGDLALSNTVAQAFFADLHPDVAFLGSGGVDTEAGLTDFYLDEAIVRRTMVRNAAAAYVLADSSKLGRVAKHRVVGLDELTGLITDEEPPPNVRSAFTASGGQILLA
jgi:DeoR family fructose operon transcriptional repressor